MSRAFVREDAGEDVPPGRFGLPAREDPAFDAGAARTLLKAARVCWCLTAAISVILSACAPPALAGAVPLKPSAAEQADLVVLVHGMGRSKLSMLPLARRLEREGYQVLNWGYSSTCCTVSELSAKLSADIHAQGHAGSTRIHFVGHSLGNILIRSLLASNPPENLGRIVMLAPPNQGSRAADRYARALGWLLKPIPELKTGETSTARSLVLPSGVEVGIIAGEYDGKVSVMESHLAGEADHMVVQAAHSFLMNRRDVQRFIVDFLREGRFGAAASVPRPAAFNSPSVEAYSSSEGWTTSSVARPARPAVYHLGMKVQVLGTGPHAHSN